MEEEESGVEKGVREGPVSVELGTQAVQAEERPRCGELGNLKGSAPR